MAEDYTFNEEELQEIKDAFDCIDKDQSGYIECCELKDLFDSVNIKLARYQVRDLIKEFDKNEDQKLSYDEFKVMYAQLQNAKNHNFIKVLNRKEGLQTIGGMTEASSCDTTHTVGIEERAAFGGWMNRNLEKDADCKPYLPINTHDDSLYTVCQDGVLISKMINVSCPDTIDERVINKGEKLSVFKKQENLTLVINSAKAIGCSIVNIGPEDLIKGKPHLVLGLLWQIIKIGLLSDINVGSKTELIGLLNEGETIEDLSSLSPEELLIRWVNYHLKNAGTSRRITNFGNDIQDSEVYLYLLQQVSPEEYGVATSTIHTEDMKRVMEVGDLEQRAELTLCEADKIGCRVFVSAEDICNGNQKLNLAFVANLFNNFSGMEKQEINIEDQSALIEETREEKTFRNWMNSMGIKKPVYHLYSDLAEGLTLLELFDKIRPGCVDWVKRVNFPPFKMAGRMKKIENCNYCVDLGKECKFSLVGIGGPDIADRNPTLTLGLVWQMMRAYTLQVLMSASVDGDPVSEAQIIDWANKKLEGTKARRHFCGFKDPKLADGKIIIDLIAAVKPNSINYDLVKDDAAANAKYAIAMGRKIGASLYASPDDILEVQPKMMLTIFAFLMVVDLSLSKGVKG